jgi:hypothetical protein
MGWMINSGSRNLISLIVGAGAYFLEQGDRLCGWLDAQLISQDLATDLKLMESSAPLTTPCQVSWLLHSSLEFLRYSFWVNEIFFVHSEWMEYLQLTELGCQKVHILLIMLLRLNTI